MKNNKFYHTSVEINEYPFKKEYLNEINNELIDLINNFNNCKDINLKYQLGKQIPINFPKCRFCGKDIINLNFRIRINKKNKCLNIIVPSVYCREINGNKYYLSCCENCLLDHFKYNPPKSNKYYFMKANKYGQYSFGYSNDEYKKICSMTVGVTKEIMIKKHGKKEGLKKWKEYCNKQKITNTFKYKQEKYHWTKEQFDQFNKNRAVTKENLINKYGEELGLQYFNDYVNKQKYTKSKEYMIEKFGEEKTQEINQSKAITLQNFIKKYGEIKGIKKYEQIISKLPVFYSNISQDFFNKLDEYLNSKYTTYYATKNTEYGVKLDDIYIRLDYFILELNLCIEFNGTYYHGDPRIFNENDYPNPHNKNITAKEIWENDNKRYKMLKEKRNIDTIVIWENDYRNGINIEQFIKEKLKVTL